MKDETEERYKEYEEKQKSTVRKIHKKLTTTQITFFVIILIGGYYLIFIKQAIGKTEGIFLLTIVLIIMYFLLTKVDEEEFITMEDARAISRKYLEKIQENREDIPIGQITLLPDTKLTKVNQAPHKYKIGCSIRSLGKSLHKYIIELGVMGDIQGFYKCKGEIDLGKPDTIYIRDVIDKIKDKYGDKYDK